MKALVIGQGLAGTLIAATLLEENCFVKIVDPGIEDSSSRVAAGMIHPVTGRRLAKSWKIDELLPFATDVYRSHEQWLNASFLHALKTLELYQDQAHRNEWLSRSADPAFMEYTGEECKPEDVPAGITKGLGGIYLHKGGWLDTGLYLDSWRNYFRSKDLLEQKSVSESEIIFRGGKAIYRDLEFDAVIDCRGAAAAQSSWFSYLPFNPAKGEVLTITCNIPRPDFILHKSVKLIPSRQENEFLCGATFSWHELDTRPSEKGRKELEEKLSRLLTVPFTIISQRAGIRPATKDRRPFVGAHPEIENLYILNGLGAKGVLLAPYMAKELTNLILHNKPVMAEVDLKRISAI